MAYAPYEEDEDENLSPVAQPSGAGLSSVGSYGPTQVNNPSPSGRFTNFSSYFNANKSAANTMGTGLADRLEGSASTALAGAKKAETETTESAAANTLKGPEATTPGQPASAWIEASTQIPTTLDPRKEAEEKKGTIYKGPTQDSVSAAYDPFTTQADKTGREIGQTKDAAGTKAVMGGTGFDAQLAHVAGGGRLSGLRQKYGGISKAVSDSKALAVAAANNAQETTRTSTAAWDQRSKDFAETDRLTQEAATGAQNAKNKADWNTAIDGFNQSIGKEQNAVLGEQQAGGHIPTTGERPSGANFAAMMPDFFKNRTSPGYVPPYFLERVFDSLSDDEARAMLAMKKDPAFVQLVRQMAQKYKVV
jgi:hypothetical protein